MITFEFLSVLLNPPHAVSTQLWVECTIGWWLADDACYAFIAYLFISFSVYASVPFCRGSNSIIHLVLWLDKCNLWCGWGMQRFIAILPASFSLLSNRMRVADWSWRYLSLVLVIHGWSWITIIPLLRPRYEDARSSAGGAYSVLPALLCFWPTATSDVPSCNFP